MLFNTYLFVFAFLPLALAAFYVCLALRSSAAALASTVLFSLLFYAYWRADYVPVLLTSILINYFIGSAILRGRKARAWVTTGVVLNLSFLGYFKYANFTVGLVDALGAEWPYPNVALPLAVSFYTHSSKSPISWTATEGRSTTTASLSTSSRLRSSRT
jgi:D-alanyl-lipoteichoic acid acyltransferase DltB (MBOAT superfamily)